MGGFAAPGQDIVWRGGRRVVVGATESAVVSSAWNPADKGANQVLSNGNRTVTQTAATDELVRGTQSRATGKWKVEITADTFNGGRPYPGLCSATCAGRTDTTTPSIFVIGSGNVTVDGVVTGLNVGTVLAGETVSFEYDQSVPAVYVQRQGGSRITVPVQSATYFPCAQTAGGGTSAATINTGQAAFVIAPGSGITAWG